MRRKPDVIKTDSKAQLELSAQSLEETEETKI